MKAYIAGKITGDDLYKEKFKRVKDLLERFGVVVLNPAELPEGMKPGDYMRICFAMIDTADTVIFLEDFSDSKGARLEYLYCKYIEKNYTILGGIGENE